MCLELIRWTLAPVLMAVGLASPARAASPPVALVPNPQFNQGDASPLGWTLSGGQGRWVDRHVLEVTGNGNDSNQWQCTCRFAPGGLYRFQVRARGVGGGNEAISGPVFANRDCALTGDWTWFGYVFRAPDNVSEDVLRVGQWHSPGSKPVQHRAARAGHAGSRHRASGRGYGVVHADCRADSNRVG